MCGKFPKQDIETSDVKFSKRPYQANTEIDFDI